MLALYRVDAEICGTHANLNLLCIRHEILNFAQPNRFTSNLNIADIFTGTDLK